MKNSMGYYFEDFVKGETINHAKSKTIFESDNNLFCLLTMNHHPLHLNIDYASNSHYKKIVVVGTLVFSLVVGLTVSDLSGKAIANLSYQDINHLNPVFIGDTINAKSKIISKVSSKSKLDRGVVEVKTIGFNQSNDKVIRYNRKILIKKRSI